ncbi:hypothetical protein AD998_18280 [bacterium 336/3]|nr:hypothetical protein AD998_18280 [bacterium 336/3]
MTQRLKILTSYYFIIGLIILLLNDFVLKELYGNWLTGKLSDFAGLFIFPLFWTSLFPKYKKDIFWFTGVLFTLWKSPASQIFIDFWNDIRLWYLQRTVDYTDLMALLILPFAFQIETIKERLVTLHLTPFIPLVISVFAFMATSKGEVTCFDKDSAVYHIKHFSRDSLISELKNSGLNISFSHYHDTKYYDEHSEIRNLNDSITNLVILIRDFNRFDSTVEVSLGCWSYVNLNHNPDGRTLKAQRAYVKSVFEKKVLKRINKNIR